MVKSYINNVILIGKCTNKVGEFTLQMDDVIDEFDMFLQHNLEWGHHFVLLIVYWIF